MYICMHVVFILFMTMYICQILLFIQVVYTTLKLLKVYKLQENEGKNSNTSSAEVSVHPKYLYKDKGIGKLSELSKQLFIYLIIENNHGRPMKISPSDKHAILCQIPILRELYGSFNIKRELVLKLGKMYQMKQ